MLSLSKVPKKKVLFLKIGPERLPPTSLLTRRDGSRGAEEVRVGVKLVTVVIPERGAVEILVPGLVIVVMSPTCANSALLLIEETRISWMPSIEGKMLTRRRQSRSPDVGRQNAVDQYVLPRQTA